MAPSSAQDRWERREGSGIRAAPDMGSTPLDRSHPALEPEQHFSLVPSRRSGGRGAGVGCPLYDGGPVEGAPPEAPDVRPNQVALDEGELRMAVVPELFRLRAEDPRILPDDLARDRLEEEPYQRAGYLREAAAEAEG